jgi:hypothetical protein
MEPYSLEKKNKNRQCTKRFFQIRRILAMLATFFGGCAAIALAVLSSTVPGFSQHAVFPQLVFQLIFSVSLFLSMKPWTWTLPFMIGIERNPVANAAVKSMIYDSRMSVFSAAILLTSFLGLILSSQTMISPLLVFAIDAVLAGIIVDLLRAAFFRMQQRRSPEGIADWLLSSMHHAVKKQNETVLIESFETLFTLLVGYMKHGDFGALRVFSLRIVSATDVLLRAISKLPLFRLPQEAEASLLDRYSVAEALTAKRLIWVVKAACETKNSTALEEIVKLFGKLFLAFHSHHESLGHLLLMTLSQTIQKIESEPGESDRDIEVMMACSEVVKSLIDRSIDRQVSEKESIFQVLSLLETYVKQTFRRDKTINPALLMQPFAEVGNMLADARYLNMPDRDDILSELRRLLSQFSALEMVTTRLDITAKTDTSATYHEDLPFTKPSSKKEAF